MATKQKSSKEIARIITLKETKIKRLTAEIAAMRSEIVEIKKMLKGQK